MPSYLQQLSLQRTSLNLKACSLEREAQYEDLLHVDLQSQIYDVIIYSKAVGIPIYKEANF
ncbi:MAG: hypothetical protein AUK48_13230 [Oscillatoriales cyanobacterium CG2_30_44_21]|nr:MAG: hypothetical protein AUK48_13230 [Oscillatoriales cyanobacterium CG2_30_44_21]